MINETKWPAECNKSSSFVFLCGKPRPHKLASASRRCVYVWEGGLLKAEPHCQAITHCQSQQH